MSDAPSPLLQPTKEPETETCDQRDGSMGLKPNSATQLPESITREDDMDLLRKQYDTCVLEKRKLEFDNLSLRKAVEACRVELATSKDAIAISTFTTANLSMATIERQTRLDIAENHICVLQGMLKNSSDIKALNERLIMENETLKKENEQLKVVIAELNATIDELKVTISKQQTMLTRLMRREHQITAREAMRTVEWFGCVEAMGDDWKEAFKFRLHFIEDEDIALPSWMTEEAILCLKSTKADGDNTVHNGFSKQDVLDAFNEGPPSDVPVKMAMLGELERYYTALKIPFGTAIDRKKKPKPLV